MSIFTKTDEYTQRPPRNTFDGSFANNLTLKAGQITPCFCKEVIPGDSFRIDAKLGFNFQPMIFPVQTDMQCNLHFFYVRNRALWKGWENFITKTENLEGDSTPPYIMLTEENRHMFDTGEIGDYLGVPTVMYGSSEEVFVSSLSVKALPSSVLGFYLPYPTDSWTEGTSAYALFNGNVGNNAFESIRDILLNATQGNDDIRLSTLSKKQTGTSISDFPRASRIAITSLQPKSFKVTRFTGPVLESLLKSSDNLFSTNYRVFSGIFDVTTQNVVCYNALQKVEGNWTAMASINVSDDGKYFLIPSTGNEIHQYFMFAFDSSYVTSTYTVGNGSVQVYDYYDATIGISNSDRELYQLPFATGEDDPTNLNPADRIRISAMPFRAVEACYNSFYRDDRNNPLIIDGKPYYNVWVQNRDGGADTNVYKLYRKNWQQDVFTTAVQSPQQGVMPLVGVTASGQMTFSDESGKTYYLQAEFGDDGHTITGISSYSSDMPAGTLRAMVDTISTGISINDFRNVNALQRWLETNMRKGLRYKDQIEAHFGTSPTYSELQMPEFIGGMSRRVSMSAIEQTVDTLNPSTGTGNALGTLGGRASVVGNDGSPVTHYCDEHGWIIGFVTITPSPVYSQQLNKQLIKQNLLDYYFPEFAHIGYQPILNEEIAPLQCKSGQQPNGDGLKDVFGYNRAWYEYLENVDEVHGDFRTSMRHYLIQRIFNGVPKLGEDFLTVSDNEVNQVFAVEDDSDKIFGQIYFDVKMKRPFPRLGIPKLETE